MNLLSIEILPCFKFCPGLPLIIKGEFLSKRETFNVKQLSQTQDTSKEHK